MSAIYGIIAGVGLSLAATGWSNKKQRAIGILLAAVGFTLQLLAVMQN